MIRCHSCMKEFNPKYKVCPYCGYIMDSPPREPYQLAPGIVLKERYVIGKVIDYGGFSSVYKAWDNILQMTVAVKEFYPSGIVQRVPGTTNVIVLAGHDRDYNNGIERFLLEARYTNKFAKNTNIVNVQTFFEANNTAYIVMEYLEGCSLSRYLEEHDDRINSEIAVNILLSVIYALKDVHKEGVVHRDISPSNIFLCADGKVKLIDFGAAQFPNEKDDVIIELKPGYAPPEQYQTNAVQGPWTDIYALGATLYKAVTGQIPDESTNRIIDDELKTPKEVDKSIPNYLDKTLMKAMALQPELRFKSVDQFERAIQNRRHVKTLEKELKRRKRRRVRGILFLTLVILVAGGYGLFHYWTERMKEVLPTKTLEIWMIADSDEEALSKQSLFEAMAAEFTEEFPQVTLEFTHYPAAVYSENVEKAAVLGKMPDLFEPGNLDDYSLFYAAKRPTDLFELIDFNELYISKQKQDYIYRNRVIPLGLTTQIAVVNTELIQYCDGDIANMPILFMRGQLPAAMLTLDEYRQARSMLSGEYAVIEKPHIEYTNEWCIGADCDIEETVCVTRLLYYLLSDSAQEEMCIKSQYCLAIRKQVLANYLGINLEIGYIKDALESEDFAVLEECDYEAYYNQEIKEGFSELIKQYRNEK